MFIYLIHLWYKNSKFTNYFLKYRIFDNKNTNTFSIDFFYNKDFSLKVPILNFSLVFEDVFYFERLWYFFLQIIYSSKQPFINIEFN